MPLFLAVTDSTSPSPLIVAFLFTAVSFPVGALLGYLWAYRFKRQYLQVARELANLRGQNFRGELKTLGGLAGAGSGGAPGALGALPAARVPPAGSAVAAPIADRDTQSVRVGLLPEVDTVWREKFDVSQRQYVALQGEHAELQTQHAATLDELQRAEAAIDVLQTHIEDLEKQLDDA